MSSSTESFPTDGLLLDNIFSNHPGDTKRPARGKGLRFSSERPWKSGGCSDRGAIPSQAWRKSPFEHSGVYQDRAANPLKRQSRGRRWLWGSGAGSAEGSAPCTGSPQSGCNKSAHVPAIAAAAGPVRSPGRRRGLRRGWTGEPRKQLRRATRPHPAPLPQTQPKAGGGGREGVKRSGSGADWVAPHSVPRLRVRRRGSPAPSPAVTLRPPRSCSRRSWLPPTRLSRRRRHQPRRRRLPLLQRCCCCCCCRRPRRPPAVRSAPKPPPQPPHPRRTAAPTWSPRVRSAAGGGRGGAERARAPAEGGRPTVTAGVDPPTGPLRQLPLPGGRARALDVSLLSHTLMAPSR